MRIPTEELRKLLEAAEQTRRPVDVDWDNGTMTILEDDNPGCRILYELRDTRNGFLNVRDLRPQLG